MGDKNMVGKELSIFLNRFDKHIKVGSVKFAEGDFNSKSGFIKALQKAISSLDNGTYTINNNSNLFARFNIDNEIISLHKWSENTGVIMPCWNNFNE